MQGKSSLSLENYIVKKMNFSINERFNFTEDFSVQINPEFKRHIHKIDKDLVVVTLGFCINNENNDMPFSMEVDIEGLFRLENWEDPERLLLVTSNSVAILFPYLRTIVSMVTANANISPYILPVMNINALFDAKNENDN